ncbi:uncharacterized protein LOC116346596 isoform X2 [Contarinia nasturtii]|uniref:uncharacterized protein LOC116346596 isoform X2 n=1 Tax=Contarinia nasturtii TaxID=265458 RepID=UPI0012D3BCFF|nr:uncharacterized protein LOC116346596 isoform X2 [Contarinia nasturtii]
MNTFLVTNLRGRDFSGDSSFEFDLLNQSSRFKNNVFTANRDSDVLVRLAYRTFPKSIRESTVLATIQMNNTNGGYLFSVLNPLGTVVQFGLFLVPANRYVYNISLVYTDAKLHLKNQNLAVFQVPAFKEETAVAIKVFLSKVTLYLNCHEVGSVIVNNVDPVEIKIDSDSRLYVASGGPLSPEKFDGKIVSLKLYSDPETINKVCAGNIWADQPMLFTMPPMFYTTPQIIPQTASSPPISFIEDDSDNFPVTDPADISTVTPKSKFYLRIAALNEPYAGNLHGTRGADFSCYRQAVRAGIVGSFKAFLSTRIQSLQGLVSYMHWDVPIANIKGEMIFRSWKDLFDTNGEFSFQSPRLYSFNGRDVLHDSTWPRKQIWHGSNINGDKSIESFCATWESIGFDKTGMAGSLSYRRLINIENISCKDELIVLCIETIPREEVPPNTN